MVRRAAPAAQDPGAAGGGDRADAQDAQVRGGAVQAAVCQEDRGRHDALRRQERRPGCYGLKAVKLESFARPADTRGGTGGVERTGSSGIDPELGYLDH
jgi:hypothetical protein